MKLPAKIALLTLMVAMLLPAATVAALTHEEYSNLLKTRCDTVKQLVDSQRRSDLVDRINKGRSYQTIIDQQSSFSLRLRNNKVTTDAFDRQITAVQDGVNRFRMAYNRYDDATGALLNIDCKTKPDDFIQQLILARNLRQIIGIEVAGVDTELAKYRQQIVEFKQELERFNSTISGVSQ